MRLLPTWLSLRRWRNPRLYWASYDSSRPLPQGAAETLRDDNPRLAELRARYAACRLPMAQRSQWASAYLRRELKLTHFRGDNAYVWQYRQAGQDAEARYRAYANYIASIDTRGLVERLGEDGLFGCWTFSSPGRPTVSRDLLDSVNEIYFLARRLELLNRPGMTVLDIGAGYGRLAWRMLQAAPELGCYVCTDGIAESTFLCEYYLRFRRCDRAEVIALDEVDERLAGRRIDLAVNIHSFTEMPLAAVDGWISRIAALQVPWLFIVDHPRLYARDSDQATADIERAVLERHGYVLEVKEPIVPPEVSAAFPVKDCFYLFRRRAPQAL